MNAPVTVHDNDVCEKCSKYRVFISYAHDDRELANWVCNVLTENGLKPVWDRSFAYGHGFHDQIKKFIEHAHVFMPLITMNSSERGWVHQEIGYALALNVPVLPVCHYPDKKAYEKAIDPDDKTAPGQFIRELQAIELFEPKDKSFLVPAIFANLVSRFSDPLLARYCCTEQREERAITMARYADDAYFVQQALHVPRTGHVRQRGALSSFHIPDRVITESVWRNRYERRFDDVSQDVDSLWQHFVVRGGPTPFHRKVQRMERMGLSKHAQVAGYSLIINPYMPFAQFTSRARIVRLECLVEFLKSSSDIDAPCVVAINSEMNDGVNTTLVGDWFAAESVTMVGPRQTNFTTHAPSIQTRIELFETELEQLLKRRGWSREGSRENAVDEIDQIIRDLKNKPQSDLAESSNEQPHE